jgi:hypothetical protein
MLGMMLYYHVKLDNARYDAVLSCIKSKDMV